MKTIQVAAIVASILVAGVALAAQAVTSNNRLNYRLTYEPVAAEFVKLAETPEGREQIRTTCMRVNSNLSNYFVRAGGFFSCRIDTLTGQNTDGGWPVLFTDNWASVTIVGYGSDNPDKIVNRTRRAAIILRFSRYDQSLTSVDYLDR